jgi:GT2 family glycosyltransferase
MTSVTTLYDIILPPADAEPETHAMYLRSRGEVVADHAAGALHLRGSDSSAAWAAFDTYVNAFAADKWKSYTNMGSFALKVRLRGSCRVSLYAVDAQNRESMSASHLLRSGAEAQDFILPFPDSDAVLWFWDMTSDDCTLLSAAYVTDVPAESLNPVRLAVIICTFRREQYAGALLQALARNVDAGACAAGDLRVLLVDNGRTLDESVCISPYMKLIPNHNAGGSGGFARGMLEVMDDTEFQATHMLLMDDDIELPEGVLQKTFSLLRLLKHEYASACIGGAMFDLQKKYMHYASVETTGNTLFLQRIYGDIDVRCREEFLPLAEQRHCPRQYQAWWYCVYPAYLPTRYGLPYPFFFQLDDIEYFLRTKLVHVIHLNGVFVRHEPFHMKRGNAKNFYTFRNFIIFSELYPPMRLSIYCSIVRDMLLSILRFNYKNFLALRMAINNFLEGPEQMRRRGIYEELLNKANLCNEDILDISEYDRCRMDTTGLFKLPLRRKVTMVLTLNGHFLPTFILGECAWLGKQGQYSELAVIYLKKKLYYESDTHGYGIVRTRSRKILFQELLLLIPVLVMFIRKRGTVGRRYRATHQELTDAAFMREHLELGVDIKSAMTRC